MKILKGGYLRSKMLGFQSRRDYFIYAAESVGALTGLSLAENGNDKTEPENSNKSFLPISSEQRNEVASLSPANSEIDSSSQPAAVEKEENETSA